MHTRFSLPIHLLMAKQFGSISLQQQTWSFKCLCDRVWSSLDVCPKTAGLEGSSSFNLLRKQKIVFHMDILIGTPPVNSFSVLYSSIAIILLRNFFLHQKQWPVTFFACGVSVWIRCQGDSEHIKYIGKHSPLLQCWRKCLSPVIPLLAHHCSLQSLMVLFIFKVSAWASICDFRGVSVCSLRSDLTVGLCDLKGDALAFFDFLMVFLPWIYFYSYGYQLPPSANICFGLLAFSQHFEAQCWTISLEAVPVNGGINHHELGLWEQLLLLNIDLAIGFPLLFI